MAVPSPPPRRAFRLRFSRRRRCFFCAAEGDPQHRPSRRGGRRSARGSSRRHHIARLLGGRRGLRRQHCPLLLLRQSTIIRTTRRLLCAACSCCRHCLLRIRPAAPRPLLSHASARRCAATLSHPPHPIRAEKQPPPSPTSSYSWTPRPPLPCAHPHRSIIVVAFCSVVTSWPHRHSQRRPCPPTGALAEVPALVKRRRLPLGPCRDPPPPPPLLLLRTLLR